MSEISSEVESRATAFFDGLNRQIADNTAATLSHSERLLLDGYSRVATLSAWRQFVINDDRENSIGGFFAEAHNDALVSLVCAHMGLWRSSLKSIRSAIENILYHIYYLDHPVEYELWISGNFRLQFAKHFSYLESHPKFKSDVVGSAISQLQNSYRKLSEAVHSSRTDLRMTGEDGTIVIWKHDRAAIGVWNTEHKRMHRATNVLLIAYYRELLQGASLSQLRSSIAAHVPDDSRTKIRSQLGVTLQV